MTKRKQLRVSKVDHIGTRLAEHVSRIATYIYPYQQEAFGLILALLTMIVFFDLVGLASGSIADGLGNLAQTLFGWGTVPVMLLIGLLSVQLMRGLLQEDPQPIALEVVVGAEVAVVSGLVLIHLVSGGNDPLALARAQGGGGLVGWSMGILLQDLVGQWLTGLAYLVVGLAGLGLIFRLKLNEAAAWANQRTVANAVPSPTDPPVSSPKPKKRRKTKPSPQKPQPTQPPMSVDEAMAVAAKNRAGIKLPPLDLLAPTIDNQTQTANANYQAQIIEETLRGFGVPAEVVEINPGPTITQFGIKPGTITKRLADGSTVEQRIRVNKISSLINDLALALAAAPIRIETPVPGRPIVGIEVPNDSASLVLLRGSIESEAYQQKKGKLLVALGDGVSGEATVIDITALPHLLIAGATGSGKSICINSIVVNLLMKHGPDDLKFLMIDPKMVELITYNGIPHLMAPVVTDFEQVAGALAWVTREMERRYKAFSELAVRSIGGYNRKVKRAERLPFLIVIIDELADLMMLAADEVERYISRIAQMARATGIHMIIATQRPSTDVVTGLIKANFPARIAFAVTSQIDSRVILDTPGAEKLLGKGDMLYMAPDSPQLARLQGCLVSDPEINNVVDYWKRAKLAANPPSLADQQTQSADDQAAQLPWANIVKEANQDDMLQEAISLVVETGRASTSFLQRRLGIGYPRASRLMDQLEAEGVIGPADGSQPREVLWSAGGAIEAMNDD